MSESIELVNTTTGVTKTSSELSASSDAIAAQAEAQVRARFALAFHRPRDLDQSRAKMLKACKRPGFAQICRYRKPIGGGSVEGWSIRAAEEFARHFGNLLPEAMVIYDDHKTRIVRVTVTDLEANLSYSKDVSISKTVERKNPKPGTEVISSRQNSSGQLVHIVKATDDEVMVKENSAVSKAMRNSILRLIPSDILEDALDQANATMDDETARDPDLNRKKLSDGFSGLGVMPSDLREYLGHDLDKCSPSEISSLRLVYQAIKGGEASWSDFVSAKKEDSVKKLPEKKKPKTIEDIKSQSKEHDPDVPPDSHWDKIDGAA